MEATERSRLIEKIKEYENLVEGYSATSIPKTQQELNDLSQEELESWLKNRQIRLQCLIDEDIGR